MNDPETATDRCTPSCREQHTYISGLCELAATTNMAGVADHWNITPDPPEQMEARRDRAVEHAVRALTPVAGAFDFMPGHANERRISYGDAITGLADHLADYIKNGT